MHFSPHFSESFIVLRVWVNSPFHPLKAYDTGLTWQTDFGDRRLIHSRGPPATIEKQVSKYKNQVPWTNACIIVFIVWFGFSSNLKHKTGALLILWTGQRSDFLPCDIVKYNSVLAYSDLSLRSYWLCPHLANLMQLQQLTQFSNQRELSCTHMRWGDSYTNKFN